MILEAAGRFGWERVILRADVSTKATAVALVLATYANRDGENAHPGLDRLAAGCKMPESTTRRYVKELVDAGLIEQTARGNGSGHHRRATCYRLTLPNDLPERVGILPDPGIEYRSPERAEHEPSTAHPGERSTEGSTAHLDERNTASSTAHFGAEYRSLGDRVPLTLGGSTAHLGERPPRTYQGRNTKDDIPSGDTVAAASDARDRLDDDDDDDEDEDPWREWREAQQDDHHCEGGWLDADAASPCPICRPWTARAGGNGEQGAA
jgi:hypothetical protein